MRLMIQTTGQAITRTGIFDAMKSVDHFPIDRNSIAQASLNLANRGRKSLLPWRGQFSPELVELLLHHYARPETIVADPFVGSGTTLFEATRKSLSCFGIEINPAAAEMSNTVRFANIEIIKRKEYIDKAETILKEHIIPLHEELGLSSFQRILSAEMFKSILHEALKDALIFNILINTLLRLSLLKRQEESRTLLRAFDIHKHIVERLPFSEKPCKVFLSDARRLPLADGSVDLVITSPPYINVFNYHQNYRHIMEIAGWDMLGIARSEIGSNRKNRMNRFLTVIQYSMDMLEALSEMSRITRPDGRIIIIIGRESKVRNISFQNFRIVSALAVGGIGLKLICRQERVFVNRFGETICEDLLHFSSLGEKQPTSVEFARDLATCVLEEALQKASPKVCEDIKSAISQVDLISPSSLFTPRNALTSIGGY